METVLREDREALRSMQKHQPRFTEEQKRELSQVHPWIRTGRLPRAINISVSTHTHQSSTLSHERLNTEILTGSHVPLRCQGCTGCKSPPSVPAAAPFDVEIHEMELCSVLKAQEEGAGRGKKNLTEAAMDEAHPEDEDEEAEEKGTKTQDCNQDMTAEEQRATSEATEEKVEAQPPESDMTH